MFGPMGAPRILQQREQARTARQRDVTEAEFRAAMKAAGAKKRDIDFQVGWAKISVGHMLVGGEMLRIVERDPLPARSVDHEEPERWDSQS